VHSNSPRGAAADRQSPRAVAAGICEPFAVARRPNEFRLFSSGG